MPNNPDLKDALAQALTTYLQTDPDALGFGFGSGNVLKDWPDASKTLIYPTAVLLAPEQVDEELEAPFVSGDATGVTAGKVAVKYGEANAAFVLEVWCNSDKMRRDIRSKLTAAFGRDPRRSGLYLAMANYWGEQAAFVLKSIKTLDDADAAQRSERRLHVEIEAEACLIREVGATSSGLAADVTTYVSTNEQDPALTPDQHLPPTP
jgi:hypothetical protein